MRENNGLDSFFCEDFGVAEAAFRLVCTAYNLMNLYKIALINSRHSSILETLKFQCIVTASYLFKDSKNVFRDVDEWLTEGIF